MNKKKEWRWSNGERYEQSRRKIVQVENENTEEPSQSHPYIASPQVSEQHAVVQSLADDENWFADNAMNFNKRENVYNKMAERQQIGQIGANPFLQNNEYINDVMVQDNYLKPKSTSD